VILVQTYEITFTGQAGATLRAEFDDCEITIGPGTTTLRAELPDQAALIGLIDRIADLRLELIHIRLAAPPPPGASPPQEDRVKRAGPIGTFGSLRGRR
jgi:hypothetical protein